MSAELPNNLKDEIVFANGPAHPELGARVAKLLGVESIAVDFKRFADSETYFRYAASVRGRHVLAFQTHAPVGDRPTSDAFYVHLQMIDAAVGGRAGEIT